MQVDVEKLVLQLSKHPELVNRLERMLAIVENRDGLSTRADDAELHVVSEVRAFGKELLEGWAKEESQKREEAVLESGFGVKKKGKKNFTGTRYMER